MPTYLGFRWREARLRWERAWRYARRRNTWRDDDVMRAELGLGLPERELTAIIVGLQLMLTPEVVAVMGRVRTELRPLDPDEIDSLISRLRKGGADNGSQPDDR